MQQELTTKQQRLNWYKKALQWFIDRPEKECDFICLVLSRECEDFIHLKYERGVISEELLPELAARRTTDPVEEGRSVWFIGRGDRMEALRECIEEMEKELLEEHEREMKQHMTKGLVIMIIFTAVVIVSMFAIFIHLK